MEEKTSLLICLGASTAANCVPCFEHYHKKASAAGLTPEKSLRRWSWPPKSRAALT